MLGFKGVPCLRSRLLIFWTGHSQDASSQSSETCQAQVWGASGNVPFHFWWCYSLGAIWSDPPSRTRNDEKILQIKVWVHGSTPHPQNWDVPFRRNEPLPLVVDFKDLGILFKSNGRVSMRLMTQIGSTEFHSLHWCVMVTSWLIFSPQPSTKKGNPF